MVAPSVPRLRNRLAADRTIRSRVCSLCSAGYRIVSLKDYMHHLIAPVKETSGHFKSSIEFSRGHEYQCRLAFQQHYASLSHEFSLRSSASPDNNACHLLLRISLDPGYVAHQTHNDSVRNELLPDTSTGTHSPGPTVVAQVSEVPDVGGTYMLEIDGGPLTRALSKIDSGMPSLSQSSGTFGPTKARLRRFCRVVQSWWRRHKVTKVTA